MRLFNRKTLKTVRACDRLVYSAVHHAHKGTPVSSRYLRMLLLERDLLPSIWGLNGEVFSKGEYMLDLH